MMKAVVMVLLAVGTIRAQSVFCTCSNRYFNTPAECRNNCRQKITCHWCMVSAEHCNALAKVDFKKLYNQAVFGLTLMGGPATKIMLVNSIVDNFYRPNRHTDFETRLGTVSGGDDYAQIQPPASGSRPTLVVAPDATELSPAGLVSAIGHEMIHIEQLKRQSRIRVTYITPTVTALREMEASSWETNAGGYRWSIGTNTVFQCMPADEQQGPTLTLRCRTWQVKKTIQNIRSSPRAAQTLKELESWMKEDPWVSAAWLPRNPNWKTMEAGARPDDICPVP
jgi:hypothetical protein